MWDEAIWQSACTYTWPWWPGKFKPDKGKAWESKTCSVMMCHKAKAIYKKKNFLSEEVIWEASWNKFCNQPPLFGPWTMFSLKLSFRWRLTNWFLQSASLTLLGKNPFTTLTHSRGFTVQIVYRILFVICWYSSFLLQLYHWLEQ